MNKITKIVKCNNKKIWISYNKNGDNVLIKGTHNNSVKNLKIY